MADPLFQQLQQVRSGSQATKTNCSVAICKEAFMIRNNGSHVSKTVYFRVSINGRMELVPMMVTDEGSLRYIRQFGNPFHSGTDSQSIPLGSQSDDD
jgi:hypothetical protein